MTLRISCLLVCVLNAVLSHVRGQWGPFGANRCSYSFPSWRSGEGRSFSWGCNCRGTCVTVQVLHGLGVLFFFSFIVLLLLFFSATCNHPCRTSYAMPVFDQLLFISSQRPMLSIWHSYDRWNHPKRSCFTCKFYFDFVYTDIGLKMPWILKKGRKYSYVTLLL